MMRRAQKRAIKLETIYHAALKVFAEYGFKKATIEDIAAEIGTAKSSLYFYIKDKRDLYDKAVAYGFMQWQGKVRAAIAAESDAAQQFHVMAHKAYEYLSKDRPLRKILLRDPSLFPIYPSAEDPYTDINRASIELLKQVLKRGIDEGSFRPVDIEAVAPLLFSFYAMLIQKTYMVPETHIAKSMFASGIDLILKGLVIEA
jgi:AcrR family transcriptional regulator